MNTVKLIASDMDHTLLTEQGELPPDFDHYLYYGVRQAWN